MPDKQKSIVADYQKSSVLHTVRLIVNRGLNRLYMSRNQRLSVAEQFHKMYYDAGNMGGTWSDTYWLGARIAKCPFDLWTYQELFYEIKPDVIVECGTYFGGSAAYFASLCDLMGKGRIHTIDVIPKEGRPEHDRINYVDGSSTDPVIFERIKNDVAPDEKVMVILDSDHRKPHVYDELRLYADLVTTGSYLVVEDTNINGHPVAPEFGPGPMEALEAFLQEDDRFEIDESREKFFVTFNPKGFLKKIRD